jgi:hypothetical protein
VTPEIVIKQAELMSFVLIARNLPAPIGAILPGCIFLDAGEEPA